ncbi:MAG: NADP oxidoreductase [Actinomycetota bacterium]|nr:MAG: NADP oxidoreductase [Actinomycetota bacterium]
MATIGFIGSGKIGGTVAALAVAAGYDVVLSNSRGPQTLEELVGRLGPAARAGTVAEAASAGDLVLLSVPLKAYRAAPPDALAGRVVIDTGNYYPQRDGQIAALDDGSTTSSALVQQQLAASAVVKAFNNIQFERLRDLARPGTPQPGSATAPQSGTAASQSGTAASQSGTAASQSGTAASQSSIASAPQRAALPIAADDDRAAQQVADFLDTIGYDAVRYGGLADSWRQEPQTPVYGTPYHGTDPAAIPAAATAAAILAAVQAATR